MLGHGWGKVRTSSQLFQMASQLELPWAWALRTAEDTLPQVLVVVQQPCCYSCGGQEPSLPLGAPSPRSAACVVRSRLRGVSSQAWGDAG